MPTISRINQLEFTLDQLPTTVTQGDVLMADPRDFDVCYAINPHMLDAEGQLLRVDRDRARQQWEQLRSALEQLGLKVHVLPPMSALEEGSSAPDLVFCANPCLPVPAEVAGKLSTGARAFIPGRMASVERAAEVSHVAGFLNSLGLAQIELTGPSQRMEGTGDGLWHPGRRLLWAGVGPRSDTAAWAEIAERFDLQVICLGLVDEDFYHLDTALALLDETTALVVESAFDPHGLELIHAVIPHVINCPEHEARRFLAANAICPDGKHVILEAQCVVTISLLRDHGYEPVPVHTSEFLKSGGSAFCMKLCF